MQVDQNALHLMKSIAASGGRVTLHDTLFDEAVTDSLGLCIDAGFISTKKTVIFMEDAVLISLTPSGWGAIGMAEPLGLLRSLRCLLTNLMPQRNAELSN